ncbi:unnamed protein product [Cladocopium goreaui]|uniref:Uncharacterized protein n=1 Tax=Cladocopium goreaui TaxID=2562237 RepID=A0A9P1GF54_9DINO|nr:unnamed protein product [Cladocopium goreaui]
MASQMAKKMMERREKLAFGSLDAVSKPMPNAANYAADVSNTATKRPKCDTKTNAGNAGNAGNEDSAESIDNQSLVLSPVGPVPKILGPHNKQDIQKFDIYTPRIEGIEISTPREDGEMPRRRTCPRTGRTSQARGAQCVRRAAMRCDSIFDGMMILSSNGIFKPQFLFPRVSFLSYLPK